VRAEPAGRRLRVPRPLPPTLSRAFKTEIAPTESLFGRWSRYCDRLQISAKEATAWLRDGPPDPNASPSWIEALVRTWKHDRTVDLSQRQSWLHAAAVMRLSRPEFTTSTLFDLSPTDAHKKHVVNEPLRACWRCMRTAFHSALFQHPALARCPLHGCLLASECPNCGAAIGLDLRFVATSPFACRKCGGLWQRSVMTAQDESERALAGTILARHRQELAPLSFYSDEYTKMWTANAHLVHRRIQQDWRFPAQGARSIARWCAWPLGPGLGWEAKRFECFTIEDWNPEGAGEPLRAGLMPRTRHAATSSLHGLAELCKSHRLDMALLRLHAGLRPRGMVLHNGASQIALALHLTMQAYAAQMPDAASNCTDEMPYGDVVWNGHTFDRGIPESDQATSILLRYEITGYFAWCLLKASNLSWATEARWSAPEPSADYLPAWIVRPWNDAKALQVRSRTSLERLPRLIRRLSPRCDPGASVQSSALTEAQRVAWTSLRVDRHPSETESLQDLWVRDLARRIAETRHLG
jgi:hypothetical protein